MENKIRKMCIISQGYPTDTQPWFPFVDQLVCAIAELGIECTVIAPQSITKTILSPKIKRPVYWEKKAGTSVVKIYQPYMVSISNLSICGHSITDDLFEKAVMNCFEKIKCDFDVIYGHFWKCGLIAARIGGMYNIPSFVACGESCIPYNALKKNLQYCNSLSGVICVSTKSKDESISLGLCSENKTIVCPNAVDNTLFCAGDRILSRQKLGYDKDTFIVAFVGSFSERKGSRRLSDALDMLEDVYSIFVGSGSEVPTCKNRLYTGSLPHHEVPLYLQAADVFVLPTKNEGCCNAVVEAMACGLPIISSDLPFNYDVLDASNSIMINPNSVTEIYKAIDVIRMDKEKRVSMGIESLKKAASLSITNRAKRIIQFMEGKMKNDSN